jgi:hypothetical protein
LGFGLVRFGGERVVLEPNFTLQRETATTWAF